MKRYLLLFVIAFVCAVWFWPSISVAAFSTLNCSGPWLGSELLPSNSYPNDQFDCPKDINSTQGNLSFYNYRCQDFGTPECWLSSNSSIRYTCNANPYDRPTSFLIVGCAGTASAPKVLSITPSSGIAGTTVSGMTITGENFATGYDVTLRQGTSVITCSFNLSNATLLISGSCSIPGTADGVWDVWVGYPNGYPLINGFTVIADSTPPSTPGSLTATAQSSSQINLSWTASTDTGGSGLAGYRVYRDGIQINTTTATSYSDTGLTPSTAYRYYVIAYDAASNSSSQSNTASATTLSPPDSIPPAAITDLTASNPTVNSITLSWTAPGDDGNAGTASVYDLRYS